MARVLLLAADGAEREAHARALREAGHAVLCAPGLNAALGPLSAREQGRLPLDLMVLELGLDDAHGIEVGARLRALPGAAILPALGLADAPAALRGALDVEHVDDVLLRPVAPEALVAAVRRLLDEGAEPQHRLRRLLRSGARLAARLDALRGVARAVHQGVGAAEALEAGLRALVEAGAFDLAVAMAPVAGGGWATRALACAGSPPAETALTARVEGLAPPLGALALGGDEGLGLVELWVGALPADEGRPGLALLGCGRVEQADRAFIVATLDQLALAWRLARGVERLARSRARLQLIAEELPRGLLYLEDGALVEANARARAWLGPLTPGPLPEALREGIARGELERVEDNGEVRFLRIGSHVVNDQDAMLVIVDDHTEARRREASLRAEARVDALTGLGNRRALDEEGAALLAAEAAAGRPCSLLFMDLDHFKEVNDRLGHAAGDALLRAVGEALRRHLRREDLVARPGGDEFAVLLPGVSAAVALERAEALRQAARAEAAARVGEALAVDASVGVATARGGTLQALVQAADRAMYEAKRAGRGRVVQSPTSM